MKKTFNFKKLFRYSLSFFGYATLSLIGGNYSPFALSLLVANLYVGLKPLPSFLLYSLTFLPCMQITTLLTGVFAGGLVSIAFEGYSRFNKKPALEIALIMALGLTPYCALSTSQEFPLKLIVSACIILSSFIMTSGAKFWIIKGLKYRLDLNDLCSAIFLYFCCAYGAITVFGEGLYLAFAIFAMLLSSIFIKGYSPILIGALTSIPLAVFRLDLTSISVFIILALAISLASAYSKLFTVILCSAALSCIYFFTSYFAHLNLAEPFYSFISFTAYLFLPVTFCDKWNKTLAVHRADNISKYSVNMHRNLLSGKIFEFSAVFDEMKTSIEKLKENTPKKQDVVPTIADDLFVSVCSKCPNLSNCKNESFLTQAELNKIVELGIMKDSLNLVDLPKAFAINCHFQEDFTSKVNDLINKYNRILEEKESQKQSRELIIKQTEGLSVALKQLATDLCKQLQHDKDVEIKIKNNLLSCGIPIKEIALFKGGEEDELILVTYSDFVSHPLLLTAISEITGYKTVISTNNRISQELSAITVKRAPLFDATFGLANKVKFDNQKSGDTHSIIKISEGKFLIALNDGMGSGERAEETSGTAISLVETFYKAGLKSEIVLPLVNKLLAFGEEDNFTALDVGVIDLFSAKADFIKIGSPYSFIITKDTVKIIEGNSLPLGILEEMRPTVCKTELNPGDVILFVSDGITDAFESSSDLIYFLSTQKASNPKTLADNVLERALFLSGGIAKDDMTAFCVRIFKKVN